LLLHVSCFRYHIGSTLHLSISQTHAHGLNVCVTLPHGETILQITAQQER